MNVIWIEEWLRRKDQRQRIGGCWYPRVAPLPLGCPRCRNSENSKANRIETMKGPAESGQICSVGRRKIAKKIAKNKRCYANTLRPRSRMLLKVSGLLRVQPLGEVN